MRTQVLTFGAVFGSVVGLIVSILMTFVDWGKNPSGLFHNDHGTNWGIVAETLLSWFWPVALGAFAVGAVVRYGMLRKEADTNAQG